MSAGRLGTILKALIVAWHRGVGTNGRCIVGATVQSTRCTRTSMNFATFDKVCRFRRNEEDLMIGISLGATSSSQDSN